MNHTEKISYSYVNGQFVPQEGALISVQDRGFRFGDGIFDTIAIHDKIPYQWNQHLTRINQGLEALRIDYDTSSLASPCKELLHKNNVKDGFLRIAISRGSGSSGYLPMITTSSTIVIETLPTIPKFSDTITLWKSSYTKPSLSAYPVHVKTMQGLNSTLARMEAQDNQCFDALLCNEKGFICETSSANIFWHKNGVLHTPALTCGTLTGTTREAIIRLSPLPVEEGEYTISDIEQADDVFLTNVSWQILPVKSFLPANITWSTDLDILSELYQLLKTDIEEYNKTHQKQWANA